ncbi:MAG TPA: hypothetical protein EYH20_07335 [Leucothrix sp.]|nr:hypothetical protein [Leucothrix sp.]
MKNLTKKIIRYFSVGLIGSAALVLVIILIKQITLQNNISNNISKFVENQRDISYSEDITGKELDSLPEPVQRYAKQVMKMNTKDIKGVRFNLSGEVKLPERDDWLAIKGQQYVSALKPAFLWNIKANVNSFLWVEIQDRYESCGGNIDAKAYGILPMKSHHNVSELSKTQLVRWSSLLPMLPHSLVRHPNIEWIPVDENSSIARITDCDMTSDHIFNFDKDGSFIEMTSRDRYEFYQENGFVQTGSIIYRTKYKNIDGVSVPTYSTAIRIENGQNIDFLKETYSDIEFIR